MQNKDSSSLSDRNVQLATPFYLHLYPHRNFMNVPLLDLKAQFVPLKAEIMAAIEKVCDAQAFILGAEVEAFEAAAAEYCGSKFAIGCSSGTDALLMALLALDIGPGDEVITSPYSFYATGSTIARVGAKPVFCDIDADTFNISVASIEAKITKQTKAIMPVHLFGQMADMNGIIALSKRYSLPVIEDAAQAIGAELDGMRAGSVGEMGCFSFFPSKNLGAFGDAGLVTTDDPALASKLKMVRVHGSERKYFHEFLGGNFRIDALQAAVLRIKLKHLDAWTTGRQANAARYAALFAAAGVEGKGDEAIQTPTIALGRRHIFNQFVIRSNRRDQLKAHLIAQGIGVDVYYPLCLHQQKCFEQLGYKSGDFPVSEAAANSSLALPIFPELTPPQLEYTAGTIVDFLRTR